MFLPNPGIMAAGSGEAAPGQQLFLASGSFVIPDFVQFVSAVCIQPGEEGVRSGGVNMGGKGGDLAYRNNIPVTPGEVLTVLVSAGRAQLARGNGQPLVDTSTAVSDQIRNLGGERGASQQNGAAGSGAAGFTGPGARGGSSVNSSGGGGTSPYGGGPGAQAGVSSSRDGMNYGGGGGRSVSLGGAGGAGCVRLIWGEGRAFPNTNTGDVTA